MTDPRYPIGPFDAADATPLPDVIDQIRRFPAELRAAVAGLTDAQLGASYRDGGWTVRQVVHHLADSHMNSAARFRLALTEDRPTIKPYSEKAWAELPDAAGAPVEASLALIDGLHARWAQLLAAMTPGDWERTFIHPERGEMGLAQTARLYAWHCRHHLGHVGIVAGRAR